MRFLTAVCALILMLASPLVLTAQQATPAPTPAAATEPDGPKELPAPTPTEASPAPPKAEPPAAPAAKDAKPSKPKPPPARELFGAAKKPAALAARSIGFYAKGCLAGAAALPVDGP